MTQCLLFTLESCPQLPLVIMKVNDMPYGIRQWSSIFVTTGWGRAVLYCQWVSVCNYKLHKYYSRYVFCQQGLTWHLEKRFIF